MIKLYKILLTSLKVSSLTVCIPLFSRAQDYLPLTGGAVNGYTQINNINFSGNSDNYAGAAIWQDVNNPYKTHLNGYALSLGTGANGNRLERMHIDNNGNIGIATSSPLARLHVKGGQIIETNTAGPYNRTLTILNTGTNQVYFGGYSGDWRSSIQIQSNIGDRGLFMAPPEANYDYSILRSIKGGVRIDVGGDYSNEGSHAITVEPNGYTGIGISTPRAPLEVLNTARFSSSATGSGIVLDGSLLPANAWSDIRLVAGGDGGSAWLKTKISNWGGYFSWMTGSATGDVEVMRIDATSGNVGIGISNPQAKLAVNGDIFSKKIKVTQSGWADYVFESDYQLPTLLQVEAYIKQYKHLPEVPSAKEVEKNGLDLGDNQAILLKKIEELTLYIIDLKKETEKMKAEYESRLKKLELENEQLKKINQ